MRRCLANFLQKFGLQIGDTVTFVADSCSDEMWEWLVGQYRQHPRVLRLVRTNVGNPGSWRLALSIALSDSRMPQSDDSTVRDGVEC